MSVLCALALLNLPLTDAHPYAQVYILRVYRKSMHTISGVSITNSDGVTSIKWQYSLRD